MPASPRLQVYDRLWALQEAESYWASVVKSGNELKTTGDGWLRRRMRRLPVDYPSVWIDVLGFGGAPFSQATGYAGEDAGFAATGEWVESFDQDYEVKVFHGDANTDLTKRINLDDAVIRAFRRGGPRLNPDGSLPVSRWTYRTGTREEAVATGSTIIKVVTTIVLRVSFAFEGRALL